MFIEKFTQSENMSIDTSSQRQNNIHLPKLSNELFEGDPKHFLEFLDLFLFSIHENDSISNVQKLTYLKGLLKGDAASCISGFKITDENYEACMSLLKERYNNKQLTVSSHMTNVLNLPQLILFDRELRKIISTVETHLCSLENLGIQSEMYRSWLIPVLFSKSYSELSLIIKQQFDRKDCWDVRFVLKCFKSEIRI